MKGEGLYRLRVVSVMGEVLPSKKTAALEKLAKEVFGELRFDAFKTDIGIVGTRWEDDRPIIFKTNPGQAFTGGSTFEPGFGCTIADAVVGSCSAYPFFLQKLVTTGRGDKIEVRDGGFVANNPTLYAIADATGSLGYRLINTQRSGDADSRDYCDASFLTQPRLSGRSEIRTTPLRFGVSNRFQLRPPFRLQG